MQNTKALLWIMSLLFVFSCGEKKKKSEQNMDTTTYEKGSFGYDLDFLKEKDIGLVLLKQGNSRVIVSPKYQAKVFTSSTNIENGKSFGWINYSAFQGEEDPHMNAYGGENRFWLGPEGSKYSLFFKPGSEMVFENWKTPAAVDTETWKVQKKSDSKVSMKKEMSLLNYANTKLEIEATRSISILDKKEIESTLDIQLDSVENVGFKTENKILNAGNEAWTKETGAPAIWILDMFKPSEETLIVIPYHKEAKGKVATTDYFGEISKDRIKFDNGTLFFKADGKSRGKLGIPPERVKNIAGSYDAKQKILTITLFDIDKDATYLNQEWTPNKDPLIGDAMNAYNDGPLEDGSQMGPFYEIESVSPAAFLEPNESLSHSHSVFHFTGEEAKLDAIAQSVFGIGLEEIKAAFK